MPSLTSVNMSRLMGSHFGLLGSPEAVTITAIFKAVTVDGSRTYQSRSVPLAGLFIWSVP